MTGSDPSGRPSAADQAAAGLALLQAAHDDPARAGLLNAAVAHLAAAVADTPAEDRHLPSRRSNLAAALFARFRRARSLADVQEAKRHFRAALQATPTASPDHVAYLTNLTTACTGCADQTQSVEDLADATASLRQLLEVLPFGDPRRLRTSATLGTSLRQLHVAGGDLQHLDQAIEVLRQAVADTLPGAVFGAHPLRPVCLANLGNALLSRGRLPDLLLAHERFNEVVQLAGPAHPGRATLTANLGATLAALARLRPQTDDLDLAITALTDAVDLAPADDPHRPAYLANLADALRTRVERTWDPADLDLAVTTARRSLAEHLAQSPSQQQTAPLQSTLLAILGGVLETAAEVAWDGATLDEAVEVLDQALSVTAACNAKRPQRMVHLANALRSRAERRPAADAAATKADLERAQELLDAAIAAAVSAGDIRVQGKALANLSAVHNRLAEFTGDSDRLDQAVATARAALDLVHGSDGDGDRPGRLVNLAVSLCAHHRQTGDPAALDEAVQAAEDAAEAAIGGLPGTAAVRADALTDLSIILTSRYLNEDRDHDLDAAVDAARAAVALTAGAAPQLAARWANLGNVLRLRGVRSRRTTDLDEAVATLRLAAEQAVQGAARDGPDPAAGAAGHLSNLGAALQSRAELLRTDEGLDEAVAVLGQALDLAGRGAWLPLYLSNFGNALLLRAQYRDDPHGVAEAVDVQDRAVAAAPAGHPDRSAILANRANALAVLYSATGNPADLATALKAVAASAEDPGARRQERIVAFWRLADLKVRAPDVGSPPDIAAGLPAMLAAVSLAEEVAWVGLAPVDRTTTLIRLASLPMDAAATAIDAGDVAGALASVESGRSVGWGRHSQRRRLDTLDVLHPELAERLRAVGIALDR